MGRLRASRSVIILAAMAPISPRTLKQGNSARRQHVGAAQLDGGPDARARGDQRHVAPDAAGDADRARRGRKDPARAGAGPASDRSAAGWGLAGGSHGGTCDPRRRGRDGADARGSRPAGDKAGGGAWPFLADRDVLLVLDNCEHVVDACAELATALLSSCADVRILATSRESLGVSGETVWRLEPLDAEDAYRLFLERARQRRPEFMPARKRMRRSPASASDSTGCRWRSSSPPRGSAS